MVNETRFRSADIQVLKRLPRRLATVGYADAFTLYGPLNLRTDLWESDLHLLPPPLAALFRLGLLGKAVPEAELLPTFTLEELKALQRLGVLIPGEAGFHLGQLMLIPALGYLLFAQRPGVQPIAYFGDDSAALAAHLAPPQSGLCLDLCTGPGIQALLAAGRAQRVIGVDVNPLAAAHAELNVVMNGMEDRVEIRVGDLLTAVEGMQFDFISANPPLLPFPPDLPYPFVGHGGGDGLGITRRILEGLDAGLTADGYCQIIGTCLGDWDGPHWEPELSEWSLKGSWKASLTVPCAMALTPGSTMFEGLAWTCASASGIDLEEVRGQLTGHLDKLSATHLYLFFLTVSRALHDPGLAMTRHYREHAGFWYISR